MSNSHILIIQIQKIIIALFFFFSGKYKVRYTLDGVRETLEFEKIKKRDFIYWKYTVNSGTIKWW